MFMAVAAMCIASMSPDVPRWALMFDDATDEEKAEALRLFGDPYGVNPLAQLQIDRGWKGQGYQASKPTWDLCGPVGAETLADLRARFPEWRP